MEDSTIRQNVTMAESFDARSFQSFISNVTIYSFFLTLVHGSRHFIPYMFIAILDFALASEWMGETEENLAWDWIKKVGKVVVDVVRWIFVRGQHFDEHQFLDIAEKQLGCTFKNRQFTRTQVDGRVWICGNADELVLSAYHHPTKAHSVAIHSGATAKILPEKVEVAPAGAWAIAFGNPGSSHGNEALYKVVE